MAKLLSIRILVVCVTIIMTMKASHGIDQGPEAVEEWFEELPYAKAKLTKLHFYFREVLTGKDATAVDVADPIDATESPSRTSFGTVVVIDDALTLGPEPGSKIIGRAEGTYTASSQEETSLLMAFSYVFTDGEYNGSTLSVLGRNSIFNEYREMPIVGGTGAFRLAWGTVTAKTYSLNASTLDAVVEHNVVVLHY